MKDMLFSSFKRSIDLHPLRELCSNRSLLDIGANIGMTGYDALVAGAKSIDLIEWSSENNLIIDHILSPSNTEHIRAFKADMAKSSIRAITSKSDYQTVFFLATYQHLEKQRVGSGRRILNEILYEIGPEYLAFRAKHYEKECQDLIEAAGYSLVYWSHINSPLAPLMIFKAGNQ